MQAIQLEFTYSASVDAVWDALVNTEALHVWFFQVRNFKPEEGNEFHFYEPGGNRFLHRCTILKLMPKQLLSYTWSYPDYQVGNTLVTWQLEPQGEETKVLFSHEGVEQFEEAGPEFTYENFVAGWNAIVKNQLRNYLHSIKKLEFTVDIKATPETIWKVLWGKETYSAWTQPFCDGSYMQGDLQPGARVHFLTPAGDGMFSDVLYLIGNESVIFSHIGNIRNFKETELDEETRKWTGCFESYRLLQKEGFTEVKVEVDTVKEYIDQMNITFPLALQRLKEICEQENAA